MGIEDWLEGADPFDNPTLAERLVGEPRPAKDYVLCPSAWLVRVLPIVRTPQQLVVAMLLYRKALVTRCQTVTLSNDELKDFGISRYAKYRALTRLADAGMVSLRTKGRRSIEVTLHWFP
jgi:hypothetical protein